MTVMPKGWAMTTIDQIADINPRHPRNLDDSLPVTFVRMPSLSESGWKFESTEERLLGQVRKGFTHFAEGDVLFAKITPCMENGKAAVASNLTNGIGCGTTELHVLRPLGGIDPTYLYHFIHRDSFRERAARNFTGTAGQLRVPASFIREREIPLPPLNEQRRIVAKLDELLNRVDGAQAHLATIPTILKRFRQSVLAAACSGRLTTDWRIDNRGIFIEDIVPAETPFDIPRTWKWTRWGDLAVKQKHSFKRGPFGSSLKKEIFVPSGYKVYEQCNPINDNCSLGSYYVTKEKFKELEAFKVSAGDLLISCSGVTLGRITQVPEDFKEGIINQALLKVTLDKQLIRSAYFISYFRSAICQSFVFDGSQGSAQPNVKSVKQLKEIPVPVPPLVEQKEIIRRVEALFKTAHLLEARYRTAKDHVDKLTQSILARAFRSELVAQDPNDEPASVLLQRIRKSSPGTFSHPVLEE
jgi:type I restriction enzyme S subunit